jgi:heptosyltransferase-2
MAALIEKLAGHERVRSLAGQELPLGLTKACLKRSRLLITTDSGPRHIAAALGRPLITLFGPTHPAWSDTHYDRDTPLQLAVDCGPCQQRECPLGHHRCMRELSVDLVWAEVRRQMGG